MKVEVKARGENTNLFSWATKELSQDAVISWILASKHGNDFLKVITKKRLLKWEAVLPEDFEIDTVYSHDTKAPCGAMDIFVEITNKNSNEKYAVIIEDKTSSSLHSQQLLKYVAAVAKKKRKRKAEPYYAGIHFVLIKTGKYYFWEHENYLAEANSIENYKTDNSDISELFPRRFFFTKDENTKTGTYLKDIYNYGSGKISFSYFLYEDFLNFLGSKDSAWTGCVWMKDYIDYLNSVAPKSSWMDFSVENKDAIEKTDQFVEDLVGKDVKTYGLERPSGGGKRSYSLTIEDFCRKKDPEASIKERLNFLVYVEFLEGNEDEGENEDQAQKEDKGNAEKVPAVKIGLNCQLYANENHRHGYLPSSKLKLKSYEEKQYNALRNDIKRMIEPQLSDKGWDFHKRVDFEIKDLHMCSKVIPCEGNPAENKDVTEAIRDLLGVVNDVCSKIENM